MFGIGTPELIVFGIIATILFGNRLPSATDASRKSRVELVVARRESTMKSRFKKFLWTPAFWAALGIIGCVTGLYFQRVASNGSGLWCMGLIFFGAAYIERNDW
jgi:hypothetical protein